MNDVNFIPVERLRLRRRKARRRLWAATCGAYIVLLAAVSVVSCVLCPGPDAGLAGQLADVEAQIKQSNDAIAELRGKLGNATAALETARAIGGQPDWSRLLAGLVHEMGEELVLSRCQLVALREDGKPLTESWTAPMLAKPLRTLVSQHRYQLVLQGFGQTQESVSRFTLGLEGVGLFDRVRLINSSRQTFLSGQAVAFTVECGF